jgi:ureidoglycolate lyase
MMDKQLMKTALYTLEIQPLTKSAFAPYGEVIEIEGAVEIPINQGTTTRYDSLAAIDVASEGGVAHISVFRGRCRPQPIEIHLMERHPLGSQAFMPLQDDAWLVVVAPDNDLGDAPDFSKLVCFGATGSQGVSYAKGVWHHPLLVLVPAQDFLIIDRKGDGHNLDEVWHDGPAALITP